jgi:hypothetical protein
MIPPALKRRPDCPTKFRVIVEANLNETTDVCSLGDSEQPFACQASELLTLMSPFKFLATVSQFFVLPSYRNARGAQPGNLDNQLQGKLT